MLTIWGHIWKRTVEKRPTNATNVIMPLLRQAIWGDIWKHTVEKSQTNAPNVTLHPLRQSIWGHIWKHTVEKSQTNATNVTLPLLRQSIWGHIWNRWNKYKRLHFWRCENYLSGGPTFLAPSNLCLQEVSTHYLHRHNHRQRTSDRGQNTFANLKMCTVGPIQSCEMSQIWQINLCKFFGGLG